jgi:hypothetical protein
MKYLIVIYSVMSGHPVEVGRASDNRALPTKAMCEIAGQATVGRLLTMYPQYAGKLYYQCEPHK